MTQMGLALVEGENSINTISYAAILKPAPPDYSKDAGESAERIDD